MISFRPTKPLGWKQGSRYQQFAEQIEQKYGYARHNPFGAMRLVHKEQEEQEPAVIPQINQYKLQVLLTVQPLLAAQIAVQAALKQERARLEAEAREQDGKKRGRTGSRADQQELGTGQATGKKPTQAAAKRQAEQAAADAQRTEASHTVKRSAGEIAAPSGRERDNAERKKATASAAADEQVRTSPQEMPLPMARMLGMHASLRKSVRVLERYVFARDGRKAGNERRESGMLPEGRATAAKKRQRAGEAEPSSAGIARLYRQAIRKPSLGEQSAARVVKQVKGQPVTGRTKRMGAPVVHRLMEASQAQTDFSQQRTDRPVQARAVAIQRQDVPAVRIETGSNRQQRTRTGEHASASTPLPDDVPQRPVQRALPQHRASAEGASHVAVPITREPLRAAVRWKGNRISGMRPLLVPPGQRQHLSARSLISGGAEKTELQPSNRSEQRATAGKTAASTSERHRAGGVGEATAAADQWEAGRQGKATDIVSSIARQRAAGHLVRSFRPILHSLLPHAGGVFQPSWTRRLRAGEGAARSAARTFLPARTASVASSLSAVPVGVKPAQLLHMTQLFTSAVAASKQPLRDLRSSQRQEGAAVAAQKLAMTPRQKLAPSSAAAQKLLAQASFSGHDASAAHRHVARIFQLALGEQGFNSAFRNRGTNAGRVAGNRMPTAGMLLVPRLANGQRIANTNQREISLPQVRSAATEERREPLRGFLLPAAERAEKQRMAVSKRQWLPSNRAITTAASRIAEKRQGYASDSVRSGAPFLAEGRVQPRLILASRQKANEQAVPTALPTRQAAAASTTAQSKQRSNRAQTSTPEQRLPLERRVLAERELLVNPILPTNQSVSAKQSFSANQSIPTIRHAAENESVLGNRLASPSPQGDATKAMSGSVGTSGGVAGHGQTMAHRRWTATLLRSLERRVRPLAAFAETVQDGKRVGVIMSRRISSALRLIHEKRLDSEAGLAAERGNTARKSANTTTAGKTTSFEKTAEIARRAVSAETASIVQAAKNINAADVVNAAKVVKAADIVKAAKVTNAADIVKAAKSAQAAGTVKAAKIAKAAGIIKAANIVKSAANAKNNSNAKTANRAGASNRPGTADVAGSINNVAKSPAKAAKQAARLASSEPSGTDRAASNAPYLDNDSPVRNAITHSVSTLANALPPLPLTVRSIAKTTATANADAAEAAPMPAKPSGLANRATLLNLVKKAVDIAKRKGPLTRSDGQKRWATAKPVFNAAAQTSGERQQKGTDPSDAVSIPNRINLINRTVRVRGASKELGRSSVMGRSRVMGSSSIIHKSPAIEKGPITGNSPLTSNSRITGNGLVTDNSRVSGKSPLTSNSRITGNGLVIDNSRVSGKSSLTSSSRITGNSQVPDHSHITGRSLTNDNTTSSPTDGVMLAKSDPIANPTRTSRPLSMQPPLPSGEFAQSGRKNGLLAHRMHSQSEQHGLAQNSVGQAPADESRNRRAKGEASSARTSASVVAKVRQIAKGLLVNRQKRVNDKTVMRKSNQVITNNPTIKHKALPKSNLVAKANSVKQAAFANKANANHSAAPFKNAMRVTTAGLPLQHAQAELRPSAAGSELPDRQWPNSAKGRGLPLTNRVPLTQADASGGQSSRSQLGQRASGQLTNSTQRELVHTVPPHSAQEPTTLQASAQLPRPQTAALSLRANANGRAAQEAPPGLNHLKPKRAEAAAVKPGAAIQLPSEAEIERKVQAVIANMPQLNLDRIVDKVYKAIEKKTKFENQRRGR